MKLLMILSIAMVSVFMQSCETVNKLVGADTVAELKKLWDSAPIVLETMFEGKVVRIVIKEAKTTGGDTEVVAVDEDGQQYSVAEVQKAAEHP